MNMKRMIHTILLISAFQFCTAQKMGPQTLAMLQESPAGSKIITFFEWINDGTEVSEDMLGQIFDSEVIERNGPGRMLSMFENIRSQDGQLELYDAERVSVSQYDLTVRGLASEEFLSMSFEFTSKPPYKIRGLMLENSNGKPTNKTPILSPGERKEFEAVPITYASPEVIRKEADKIARAYQDMNWFTGVVMVAKEGVPVFEKAYGLADIEKNIPNTAETRFRIGSINKMFTAILIMQMMSDGKLSPDDKLEKFGLGFPEEIAGKVTLRQILGHKAGFSDIFIPEYLDNIRAYKDIDDILPLLLHAPLIYEPGTDQQYSNYGYIVLGAILEKISGKPFAELLQERILDVIDLDDTFYNIAENITGEAQSYRFTPTGKKVDHTALLEYCTPDGGMYSTTKDLLTFFQKFFYTEELLSDEMKMQWVTEFSETEKTWADMLKRGAEIGEAGGGPGVNAVVEWSLKDNYAVIVLANTDQGVAEEIGRRIMQAVKGQSYEDPQLPPAFFAGKLYHDKGRDFLRKNLKKQLKAHGYREYHAGILNNLGYALIQENQYHQAIEVFSVNTELFPDEANTWDSLGEAYFKKGDKASARTYYAKALQIDPGLPSALRMMEELAE